MKTRISIKLLAALMAFCLLLSFGGFAAVAEDEVTTEAPVVVEETVAETEPVLVAAEETTVQAAAPIVSGDELTPEEQVISRDITPSLESGLYFKNGEFKILVLNDLEIGIAPYATILRYVKYVIEDTKPDLIVLNGDITNKNSNAFIVNWISVPWIIDLVKDYPFTITFGDQEALIPVNKVSLFDRYEKYDNFLGYDDSVTDAGVGNHNLMIFKDEAAAAAKTVGGAAFDLWMLDSNTNGLYRTQSAWYAVREEEGVTFQATYGIPSMVFTHLPLPEIAQATDGRELGKQGQTPSTSVNANMFAMMKKYGHVLAAVAGHDRLNSFVKQYDGVDFIQTAGCTYATKGDRDIRGGRLITLTLDADPVPPVVDAEGVVTTAGTAPVVSYTTNIIPAFATYFNDDNVAESKVGSRHAFYLAGTKGWFGRIAPLMALPLSLFMDKYEVTFAITQWFGDTFYGVF